MPAYLKSVTFDCADALVVARFWAAAPGSDVDEESTADKAFVEAPVARRAGLGATVVREGDELTVMRDPEGNEFCVE